MRRATTVRNERRGGGGANGREERDGETATQKINVRSCTGETSNYCKPGSGSCYHLITPSGAKPLTGRILSHPPSEDTTMADFILLYRSTPQSNWAATPEARQQTMQEWLAWMRGIEAKGQMKDMGHPLEMGGKVVGKNGTVITDGPFAESKDLIGGFSIVTARDLDEASELAKGCPILTAPGGAVEVRPVQSM